jgi:chromosome segregation ATPase
MTDEQEERTEQIMVRRIHHYDGTQQSFNWNGKWWRVLDGPVIAPQHTDEEYEKQDQLCKNLEHWVLNLKSDKAKLEARIKELEAQIRPPDATDKIESYCWAKHSDQQFATLESYIKKLEDELKRAEMFNKVADRLAERVLEARK